MLIHSVLVIALNILFLFVWNSLWPDIYFLRNLPFAYILSTYGFTLILWLRGEKRNSSNRIVGILLLITFIAYDYIIIIPGHTILITKILTYLILVYSYILQIPVLIAFIFFDKLIESLYLESIFRYWLLVVKIIFIIIAIVAILLIGKELITNNYIDINSLFLFITLISYILPVTIIERGLKFFNLSFTDLIPVDDVGEIVPNCIFLIMCANISTGKCRNIYVGESIKNSIQVKQLKEKFNGWKDYCDGALYITSMALPKINYIKFESFFLRLHYILKNKPPCNIDEIYKRFYLKGKKSK